MTNPVDLASYDARVGRMINKSLQPIKKPLVESEPLPGVYQLTDGDGVVRAIYGERFRSCLMAMIGSE